MVERDRGTDGGTIEHTRLEVRPLTGRIGAEIYGIDLTRPLRGSDVAKLRGALAEHQVIFFRDQHLDHESHKRFGRAFGDLVVHSAVPGLRAHPEILKIHTDENSKTVPGETWHSDLTCDPIPPMGSILYLHTVPDVGGDTLFASMYAAYDALSPRMKTYLAELEAVHDAEHVYREMFPDADKRYNRSIHPVILTHPVTGKKGIFVNSTYTVGIVGVPKEESDAILGFLYRHVMNPNFQVRFRWRPHSVAFWDNRCTQHLAVWDYFPQKRSGYRVTVAGDTPT